MEALQQLLEGVPIRDEYGNPTGEHTGPLISKADYVRLMDAIS